MNEGIRKIALGAAALLMAGGVWADAPILNIQVPAGTVFTTTFPYTQPITFTLYHTYLGNVKVLDIQVDGTTIVNNGTPIGSPFTNTNQCSSLLLANVSACNASDPSNATVTVPWTVTAVGAHTILVSVKHQNDLGEDEETVQVALLNAEYPAPPSVANAYINGDPILRALSARKRGCVISKIADRHAKDEAYGPRGGPYDEDMIRGEVVTFFSTCQ